MANVLALGLMTELEVEDDEEDDEAAARLLNAATARLLPIMVSECVPLYTLATLSFRCLSVVSSLPSSTLGWIYFVSGLFCVLSAASKNSVE